MPNRSTISNLAEYSEYLSDALAKGYQVDSIYTDMRSAVDSVSHTLIVSKLQYYGISGKLLDVVRSFLSNRPHYVQINGSLSDEFVVESGVPQGSNGGTLFFNISINDLATVVTHSKIVLFADDLKIYKTIHNNRDAILLQEDLDAIQVWCSLNELLFNVNKYSMITFYRRKFNDFQYKLGGFTLPRMSVVKDLGVYFDSHLTFNEHVT